MESELDAINRTPSMSMSMPRQSRVGSAERTRAATCLVWRFNFAAAIKLSIST